MFAKNQMRLAYEDKRDLYCRNNTNLSNLIYLEAFNRQRTVFKRRHKCCHIDVSVGVVYQHCPYN